MKRTKIAVCQACGRDLNKWFQETGQWRCFYCAKEWHPWIGTPDPAHTTRKGNPIKASDKPRWPCPGERMT